MAFGKRPGGPNAAGPAARPTIPQCAKTSGCPGPCG